MPSLEIIDLTVLRYQKYKDGSGNLITNSIKRIDCTPNLFIPVNPNNRDYKIYLDWVAAGNTIAEAD